MMSIRDILIRIKSEFSSNGIEKARKSVDTLSERLRKSEIRFQGWAMSIMFAGMAILRVFQQVSKFGITTFQDVMHSVEGTTTGFDILNGHIKYLQFIIGQALEPLAAQLVPIIMKIADWIEQNEELFASIVKWGIIIGGALMITGQLVLGISGLINTVKNLVTILTGFTVSTPGVLALITLAALSFKSLMETPEALDSIKESIKKIDLTPLKNAFNNLTEAIFGSKITWEDVAWAIAWGVDKAIPFLNLLAKTIEGVAEAIVSVIKLNMAMSKYTQGKFDEGDKYWNDYLKSRTRQIELRNEWFDLSEQAFGGVKESLSDFRTRVLGEQEARKILSLGNYQSNEDFVVRSMLGDNTGLSIGAVYIQTNDLESLREQVETSAYGAPYRT